MTPLPPRLQRLGRKMRRVIPSGFRGLILIGTTAAVFVLLVNVALLVVSSRLQETTWTGGKLAYRGDCSAASKYSTAIHLVINVLATLVLSTSNAAMQCLTAPTREDVDRAHRRGRWLNIGTGSLGNIYRADRVRQAAWLGLLMTSLPLHLAYNSVFLQSTQANAYGTLIVARDFFDAPISILNNEFGNPSIDPGRESDLESQGIYPDAAAEIFGIPLSMTKQIQEEVHSYSNLSWDQCRKAYSQALVRDWSTLVIVTNLTNSTNGLLGGGSPTNSPVLASFWSSANLHFVLPNLFTDSSSFGTFNDSSEIHVVLQMYDPIIYSSLWLQNAPDITGYDIPIVAAQYCLAQPAQQLCTIEIFQPFLFVVIIANLLKIICLILIIKLLPPVNPLVTFGDAVATFLSRPDPLTAGGRAIDQHWVESNYQKIQNQAQKSGTLFRPSVLKDLRWHKRSVRWIYGPSHFFRYLTFIVWGLVLSLGWFVVAFDLSVPQNTYSGFSETAPSFQVLWENGLGNVYPSEIFEATVNWSTAGCLIVANAPQLLISVAFLLYNQYFTVMCVAAEALSFSAKRQYLRVSEPQGMQRSTYWLGLPFLYSIPLLITSALLHWATSQSLFIAEVNILGPKGMSAANSSVTAVGYSLIGAVIILLLTATMLVCLLFIGIGRKFPQTMPLLSTNSLAIAAACHGHSNAEKFGPAEAEASLMYGVTELLGPAGGRVGFCCEEVQPLQSNAIFGFPEYSNINDENMDGETAVESPLLTQLPMRETSHGPVNVDEYTGIGAVREDA